MRGFTCGADLKTIAILETLSLLKGGRKGRFNCTFIFFFLGDNQTALYCYYFNVILVI